MQRQFVQSSNLHDVGYDPITLTLEIGFNDGSVYQYYGVSSLIYSGLMSASSHGKYFATNIKDAYQYRKVA